MSEEHIRALAAQLDEPRARLDACVAAIGRPPALRRNRKVWWRGVVAASKLLGCDANKASMIMTTVFAREPKFEYLKYIADQCPASAVGEVYTVQHPDYPGVIKLGFSSQLEQRLKQLRAQYKVPLEIVSRFVGTYLDEFLAHREIAARWLQQEWFGAPDNPEFCPQFLKDAGIIPQRALVAAYFEAATGEKSGPIANVGPFLTPYEAERALMQSLSSR
jgi:hypothetical protein